MRFKRSDWAKFKIEELKLLVKIEILELALDNRENTRDALLLEKELYDMEVELKRIYLLQARYEAAELRLAKRNKK